MNITLSKELLKLIEKRNEYFKGEKQNIDPGQWVAETKAINSHIASLLCCSVNAKKEEGA